MSDEKDPNIPAAPAGGERTVLATPEQLAALMPGGAAPASTANPFGGFEAPAAPPPAAPPPQAPQALHGTPGALVGAQLNDMFEITRFIAQGGMGEVYQGKNIASGEPVAIKVILPQYAADEQFFALFRREATALEKLGHDALVKYRALAFDKHMRIHYLAIEYVDGASMMDILDGQPRDAQTVARFLRRMATGLGTAHHVGVIHRDLSPDNVLLPGGQLDRAKIIDFGIAKDTNPGEKSVVGSAFAGKFGYAAPEIFGKFGREIGPWTDVYSLALVVLALARGRPLDMGVTIVDALDARAAVPDLSFLPSELKPVFEAMLQPDPARRLRSMDAVLEALDQATQAQTQFTAATFGAQTNVAAQTPPSAPAFVRRDENVGSLGETVKKKPPVALIAGGAVLALALAGGAIFALSGGGQPAKPAQSAAADDATPAATPATTRAASQTAPPPTPQRLPWETAKGQIVAALDSVPCSDIRIHDDPPVSNTTVRLTGWRTDSSSLPKTVAGWELDGREIGDVPTPSPETCAYIAAMRSATDAGHAAGFQMPGYRAISYDAGQSQVPVDLEVDGKPDDLKRIRLFSLDDRPSGGDQRVVSADAAQLDLRSVPFEAKPKRFLITLVAGRKLPPDAGWPVDGMKLGAACESGGCRMISGWVELKP